MRARHLHTIVLISLCLVPVPPAGAGERAADKDGATMRASVDSVFPQVEALYLDLHKNPELSGRETRTAATLARELRSLGFQVTTGVGGPGIVAVLQNGPGPTVMLRAELDGLPVEEKTGLPYASRAKGRDDGEVVPVMHACGHDVQMSAMVGAARILSRSKDRWRGTLIVIGQPAEETLKGARAMLADGLYTRFPRPDFVLSVHAINLLPSGHIGFRPGSSQATADGLEVTIFGKGGHGAAPHLTIDPIVIGARVVLALQTIVSRETDPTDPAVITVGSFRAGTRPNVIPDESKLQITVRALTQEARKKVLAALERTVRGEAVAAGAPKEPTIRTVSRNDPVINDPALAERLTPVLARVLGRENLHEMPPLMTSDDFAAFTMDGVRTLKIFAGAAEPRAFAGAAASGKALPTNHSALFAPDRIPILKTATLSYLAGALELLGRATPGR